MLLLSWCYVVKEGALLSYDFAIAARFISLFVVNSFHKAMRLHNQFQLDLRSECRGTVAKTVMSFDLRKFTYLCLSALQSIYEMPLTITTHRFGKFL